MDTDIKYTEKEVEEILDENLKLKCEKLELFLKVKILQKTLEELE